MYRQAVSKPRPDRPRGRNSHPTRPGGVRIHGSTLKLVADVKVRDGRVGDILAIAPFRDNYRLASLAEILKLTKKHRLYRPQRGYRPGPCFKIDPR